MFLQYMLIFCSRPPLLSGDAAADVLVSPMEAASSMYASAPKTYSWRGMKIRREMGPKTAAGFRGADGAQAVGGKGELVTPLVDTDNDTFVSGEGTLCSR